MKKPNKPIKYSWYKNQGFEVDPKTINIIVTIISAVGTLIGTLIGVSTAAYNKEKDNENYNR